MSTRIRLARLLNRCIPTINGVPVVWKAESLYPCRGFWRIRRSEVDVQSWQATAYNAATGKSQWNGGCWETMTECLQRGAIYMHIGFRVIAG